ncbi:MAG TPA: APC family permease [Gemmatimonadales bacterium]|jgi:amino acid transporter|nr:APC family permease [Gemmatimonadales bacterium]
MTLWRSAKRVLVGRPLETLHLESERLSKATGLAVLSSDALSSVAYAAEAMLLVLMTAGAAGVGQGLLVAGFILLLLAIVVVSYRQTVFAYPQGGGAYFVAKENLGTGFGLVAAAALLVDYTLTVTVSVAAGVAAITSAFPATTPHAVAIGIGAIALVALGNLRGLRESGMIFSVPTYFFIVMFAVMLLVDVVHPFGTFTAAALPASTGTAVTLWLLVKAFASGCSALTGVEAISNGIPAFRKPESKNAAAVMIWMGVILGVFFAGSTIIAHRFGVVPVGDQTVISQLAHGAFGSGPLYFGVQFSTALILVLAANTAFADFPRLASILATDGYLPRQLASRGDRLVFSNGILMLALVAGVLLEVFGGNTNALIHLYAVGVFISFTLSQAGMVRRSLKAGERRVGRLVASSLGACATAVVVVIELVTKFTEGAWISALLIVALVFLFLAINRHYRFYARQLSTEAWQPSWPEKHFVVVPVAGVSRSTANALAYALLLSPNIRAVAVATDPKQVAKLQDEWDLWDSGVPLEVLVSPYRAIVRPLLQYIDQLEGSEKPDWLTVVLPEVVPARWWHAFLHNQTVYAIKTALLFRRNVVVTTVRHHLRK